MTLFTACTAYGRKNTITRRVFPEASTKDERINIENNSTMHYAKLAHLSPLQQPNNVT